MSRTETQQASGEVEIKCQHRFTVYPAKYVPRHDADPVWMVVRYEDNETHRQFSANGTNLPVTRDVDIILRGIWCTDKKYGKNLKVDTFEIVLPTSEAGFIQYIQSLKVNIGRVRARAIFAKFGEQVWEVLENNPDQLRQITGITEKMVLKLKDRLRTTKFERELRKLCVGVLDITPRKARDIADKLGTDAMLQIQQNPYILCDVKGLGFKTVDKLALRLGVPPDNETRIIQCVMYLLNEAAASGHTCLPKDELKTRLLRELNSGFPKDVVLDTAVLPAINAAVKAKLLRCTAGMLYSAFRFEQEQSLTTDIVRLLRNESDAIESVEVIIDDYERESGMTLATSQREAVINAFRHQVTIVTGGPGTGKTTIIKAILYVHQKVFGHSSNPIFLSPTGRAARRMTEATGFPAQTIHSAVAFKGDDETDFSDADDEKIDANLFVVDESSMMDLYIASVLMKKVPDDARVIFVGDPDQLPSVGCGNVLYEMIRSDEIPTTKLNVIFRQAGESPIVTNAAKIRDGITDLIQTNQFCIFREHTSEDVFRKACLLYIRGVNAFGLDNVILLNPYREKSKLNVNEFNLNLQSVINPHGDNDFGMKKNDTVTFYKGDKVMQMKNTEAARNGDVGYIRRIERGIDPEDETQYVYKAIVEFNGDGIEHTYTGENIRELDLAYCTTVHKSQGSEFDTVIMVLSAQHETMLRRNLIYTAVTRAKKTVVLITEAENTQYDRKGSILHETAIDMAIRNDKTEARYTLLGDRIHAQFA